MTSIPVAASAVQPLATARADRLVSVRRSDVRAHSDLRTLFERTLFERTLALYPYIPGADELEELGIEPVRDPRPSDQVSRLPEGGAACLVRDRGHVDALELGLRGRQP